MTDVETQAFAAKRLLEDPLLVQAFEAVSGNAMSGLVTVDADDKTAVLRLQAKGAGDRRDHLRTGGCDPRGDAAGRAGGVLGPINEEYLAGLGRFMADVDTLPLSMRPKETFGLGAIGAVPIGGRGLGAYVRNKLASRSANIYDRPDKPARSFEADYPHGAPSDATGNLTTDMDGRSLSATYVAGRSRLGGADVALPREALDEIAKARTGSPIRAVAPRSPEIGNDVGRAVFRRDGTADSVYISRALTAAQAPRVAAHEIAHLIDKAAFDIPTRGLNAELRKIYNDLNNPQSYGKLFGPEHNRYRGADVQRELMAEAIRAYMTNPNYIKTVAPRAAARIREFVNGHPKLRGLIQFNAADSQATSRIGLGFTDDEERPIP